jgi:hypothetical protein
MSREGARFPAGKNKDVDGQRHYDPQPWDIEEELDDFRDNEWTPRTHLNAPERPRQQVLPRDSYNIMKENWDLFGDRFKDADMRKVNKEQKRDYLQNKEAFKHNLKLTMTQGDKTEFEREIRQNKSIKAQHEIYSKYLEKVNKYKRPGDPTTVPFQYPQINHQPPTPLQSVLSRAGINATTTVNPDEMEIVRRNMRRRPVDNASTARPRVIVPDEPAEPNPFVRRSARLAIRRPGVPTPEEDPNAGGNTRNYERVGFRTRELNLLIDHSNKFNHLFADPHATMRSVPHAQRHEYTANARIVSKNLLRTLKPEDRVELSRELKLGANKSARAQHEIYKKYVLKVRDYNEHHHPEADIDLEDIFYDAFNDDDGMDSA